MNEVFISSCLGKFYHGIPSIFRLPGYYSYKAEFPPKLRGVVDFWLLLLFHFDPPTDRHGFNGMDKQPTKTIR